MDHPGCQKLFRSHVEHMLAHIIPNFYLIPGRVITDIKTLAHTFFHCPDSSGAFGSPNLPLRKRYFPSPLFQSLVAEPTLFVSPRRWGEEFTPYLPYEKHEDNPSPYSFLGRIKAKPVKASGRHACDYAYMLGWLLGFPDRYWDDLEEAKQGRARFVETIRQDASMRLWFLGVSYLEAPMFPRTRFSFFSTAAKGGWFNPRPEELKRTVAWMRKVESSGRKAYEPVPRPIGDPGAWDSLSAKDRWLALPGDYQQVITGFREVLQHGEENGARAGEGGLALARKYKSLLCSGGNPRHADVSGLLAGSVPVAARESRVRAFREDDPGAVRFYLRESGFWEAIRKSGIPYTSADCEPDRSTDCGRSEEETGGSG